MSVDRGPLPVASHRARAQNRGASSYRFYMVETSATGSAGYYLVYYMFMLSFTSLMIINH